MRWAYLIGFFLLLFELGAQQLIGNFSKENELTSNEITTYLVDSKGIVWLGTSKGLCAYAAGKWYPVSQIQDNTSNKPIVLDKVVALFEDREGFIWVSTENGLFLYNRAYWISFRENRDKQDYIVKEFFQDSRGWVWTFQEYYQDLTEDLGIILLSGTIHVFDGSNWFQFDEDIAGTSASKYAG